MVKGVAHIGIAVNDLASSTKLFRTLLNARVEHEEEVPSQKVRTAMIKAGGDTFELLAAMDSESAISKFIEKRGEGIHHVAIEVEDIVAELDRLRSTGVVLVDEIPRLGAEHCLVAFLHPKSTNGVLIELVQKIPDVEEKE